MTCTPLGQTFMSTTPFELLSPSELTEFLARPSRPAPARPQGFVRAFFNAFARDAKLLGECLVLFYGGILLLLLYACGVGIIGLMGLSLIKGASALIRLLI